MSIFKKKHKKDTVEKFQKASQEMIELLTSLYILEGSSEKDPYDIIIYNLNRINDDLEKIFHA